MSYDRVVVRSVCRGALVVRSGVTAKNRNVIARKFEPGSSTSSRWERRPSEACFASCELQRS